MGKAKGESLKKIILLFLAISSLTFYQNCSGRHETWDQNGSSSGSSLNTQLSLAAFEQTLFPVITKTGSCVDCHGVSQQPLHSLPDAALSHDVLVSFNLVDLLDPANSRLVTKVRGNHQGMPQTLADEMEAAIQQWSDDLVASGGNPGQDPQVLSPTFTSINNLILQPKCVSCHSPNGSRPQEDYTDYTTSLNTGKIEPGNAAGSEMFKECQAGTMPVGGAALTTAELSAIKTWINNGALNN